MNANIENLAQSFAKAIPIHYYMLSAYVCFPKRYELDQIYFAVILRLIRYEIVTNIDHYPNKLGLKYFVSEMERKGFYANIKVVIDFGHFCGDVKSHPEFVECLNRVHKLLLNFGPEVPEEWLAKLKVNEEDEVFVPKHYPVKKILYWLDCFRQTVDEYKPNIGITIFPSAPD